MCDDLGYLEVEENGWTCIACMDRKARDWKSVLRHEKTAGHARAVAVRLRQIEDAFPNTPGSTNVETTEPALQDLLFALANRQEGVVEDDPTLDVSETDGEESDEVLDISVLSASLLGQLDSDQHLNVGGVSNLEFEGRDHGLVYLHYPSVLY